MDTKFNDQWWIVILSFNPVHYAILSTQILGRVFNQEA